MSQKALLLVVLMGLCISPGFAEWVEGKPTALATYASKIGHEEESYFEKILFQTQKSISPEDFLEHLVALSKRYNISFWGPILLYEQIKKGKNKHVLIALNRFPEIVNSIPMSDCSSLLDEAIQSGNEEVFEALISLKANVNIKDPFDQTPIFSAASKGNLYFLKRLITLGSEVNVFTESKNSPIGVSISQNHSDCAVELLKRGAIIDIPGSNEYTNPFFIAVQNRNRIVISHILKSGFNPNYCCETGGNVLFCSFCDDSDYPFFRWLVSMGCSINSKTKGGETLLHKAAAIKSPKILRFLIGHGLDVNERDGWGRTPLYLSAMNGLRENYLLLLKHGGNPGLRSKDGFFPFEMWPHLVKKRNIRSEILKDFWKTSAPKVAVGTGVE